MIYPDQESVIEDNQEICKLFKELYLQYCAQFSISPVQRFIKYFKYEIHKKKFDFSKCNISELIEIYEVSFSHNQFFKDQSIKLLIETIPNMTWLKNLQIEKINVSDSAMLKFIDFNCFQYLNELNISSNNLSYVCFDELTKLFKTRNSLNLKQLDLSNTKLTDKSGIELFESVLNYTQIKILNLSRNQNLGFKFSSYSINLLRSYPEIYLQKLDCKLRESLAQEALLNDERISIKKQINQGKENGRLQFMSFHQQLQRGDSINHSQELQRHSTIQQQQQQHHNFNNAEYFELNLKTSEQSQNSSFHQSPYNQNLKLKFKQHSPISNYGQSPKGQKNRETILTMSPISPVESTIGKYLQIYDQQTKNQQDILEQTTIHNINSNSFKKHELTNLHQRRKNSKEKKNEHFKQRESSQPYKIHEQINSSSQTLDDRSIISSLSNILQTQDSVGQEHENPVYKNQQQQNNPVKQSSLIIRPRSNTYGNDNSQSFNLQNIQTQSFQLQPYRPPLADYKQKTISYNYDRQIFQQFIEQILQQKEKQLQSNNQETNVLREVTQTTVYYNQESKDSQYFSQMHSKNLKEGYQQQYQPSLVLRNINYIWVDSVYFVQSIKWGLKYNLEYSIKAIATALKFLSQHQIIKFDKQKAIISHFYQTNIVNEYKKTYDQFEFSRQSCDLSLYTNQHIEQRKYCEKLNQHLRDVLVESNYQK
ncbi:UNKNOWN [Stylonychia lemnae]|uniref:Leucine rich repeat family protein n=1 Tax=Stylonychia lemnae TaxID=5949 RepID=A0A078A8T2_STYLE|nr:UNKNOWN [Stylonychia lemnae]|eukprot:CDW78286.1 UNKNOWN [Stylonychia lemnae]